MKVAVITACLFADEKPIHFLKNSCVKHKIDLLPYGLGRTYTDWPDIKVTQLLQHMKKMKEWGYTHVLYTDGRDSFFLTGLSEILFKYEKMGEPTCLMAAEMECYPRRELSGEFPDPGHMFRYLGSGQFIGELDYMIDRWEMLIAVYMSKPGEDQNEQGWMQDAYVKGEFGPRFKFDYGCQIFQSGGGLSIPGDELEIIGNRIHNKITNSYPCVYHYNGGYSSPETGKDEILDPIWRELERTNIR